MRGQVFKSPAMQKCAYCGHENDDAVNTCTACGDSLTNPQKSLPLPTPHRAMAEIQKAIWERFAVKRRQFYLAGFLIGAFGGLIGVMHNTEHGFQLWALPAGGALGVGAVWVLSWAEKLQVRIHQARAEGNPTGGLQVLFVAFCLIALVAAALLVAGVVLFFL